MWPEGEEPKRYDWKYGTLIVPPNAWFHQHSNSGRCRRAYLAFKHSSPTQRQGGHYRGSAKARGTQIDYADERPLVRQMFSDALAKHGLAPRMDAVYEAELPNCRRRSLRRRNNNAGTLRRPDGRTAWN